MPSSQAQPPKSLPVIESGPAHGAMHDDARHTNHVHTSWIQPLILTHQQAELLKPLVDQGWFETMTASGQIKVLPKDRTPTRPVRIMTPTEIRNIESSTQS